MKVLISCYACSPFKGSEPGMGWNFVKCLSKSHELYVISEGKFQQDIELYYSEHPHEKINVHFYFIWKKRHKKLRKLWPPSYYWFYRGWQHKAYLLAQKLDLKENFDIVHQLNMVGFREPGYLYKLKKPLVWGPIGGTHLTPWILLPSMGLYGAIYYGMRNLLNLWDIHFKSLPRIYAKCADSILCAIKDTKDVVANVWGRESIVIPEVGLLEKNYQSFAVIKRDPDEKMRIIWSGQHTPAKALNLILEALYICKHKNMIELHVIGEGKCMPKWKKQAIDMHIVNIIWHGWVPRNEALAIMQTGHVMAISSLADLTSTVLLEALSLGMPSIALNHCGFANVINDDCGIKIDINSQKRVVHDFAMAFDKLFEDEDLRLKLSEGAYNNALLYTWDAKAKKIDEVYNKIVR